MSNIYAIKDDLGMFTDEWGITKDIYTGKLGYLKKSESYKNGYRLYDKENAEKVVEKLNKNIHKVYNVDDRKRKFEIVEIPW